MCTICKTKHEKPDPCPGPPYPYLAGMAKYRKINNPTKAQREAHGDAVHAAIQALQARELQQGRPSVPDCGPYQYKWRSNIARLLAPMPSKTRWMIE